MRISGAPCPGLLSPLAVLSLSFSFKPGKVVKKGSSPQQWYRKPPPPITNPPTKALPTFVPPPSQIDMVLVYIVRVPFSSEGPCQQQPFPPSQSSKCGKTVEASTECAGWRPFMRGLGTNCRIILCTSPRQDTWRTRSPSRWRACTATWSRRIWCIKIVHLLLDDSNQPVAISCLTWWPGSHLAETLVL